MRQLLAKARDLIRLTVDGIVHSQFIESISKATSWLLRQIFGEVRWQAPPPWLSLAHGGAAAVRQRVGGLVWRNPGRTAWITGAAFVAMAVGGIATVWYDRLPKPPIAAVSVTAPGRTRLEDPEAKPDPVRISFTASVARLADVGKELKTGVELSPNFDGSWKWSDDHNLVFTPKTDWPIDAEFTVTLAKKGLIAEQLRLDRYAIEFRTAPFVARIANARFYQDPVNPAAKKIVVD